MKKLSIVAISLCGSIALFGQTNKNNVEPPVSLSISSGPVSAKSTPELRGDEEPLDIYWQDDFSDGFNGMGENGAWTTDGPEGDLWFYAFPRDSGLPGAYDPAEFNPGYFTLPNYFGSETTIASETDMNGFMMLDADAYNSLTVEPDDPQGTTENLIDSYLVSPMIDLTGYTSGQIQFTQRVRLCCISTSYVAVELSTNGGANWTEFDVFTDYTEVGEVIEAITVSIDITTQMEAAADLSEVQIRFHFPSIGGATVYYWMVDDVAITSLPDNDLSIGDIYYGDWIELNAEWATADSSDQNTAIIEKNYVEGFEYSQQPAWAVKPFNFSADVSNVGGEEQTNVHLSVDFQDPTGNIITYRSDSITLPAGMDTVLRIENVMPSDWENGVVGLYTMSNYNVSADAADQILGNNTSPHTLATRINNNYYGNGFAVSSSYYGTLIINKTWGSRYVFHDNEPTVPKYITHIEFVILGDEPTPTEPGSYIQLNIRYGSVFTQQHEDTNPLNYQYEEFDENLGYILESNDLTTTNTPVWISVPLPEPLQIVPGIIYQPEFRVSLSEQNPVYPAFSDKQEQGAGVLRDYDEEPEVAAPNGYYTLGDLVPMIRFRVSLDSTVSVSELTAENGVRLYQNWPNPANEATTVQFQLENSENVTFEMYDITGKIVHVENLGSLPGGVNQFTIETKSFSAGIYSYSIVTTDARVSRKMVISR